MLRFCYLEIVFLALLNASLAEDYESGDIAAAGVPIDTSAHLIPDSKPLQFIDHSAATPRFSVVDVIKPTTTAIAPIPMNVRPAAKTMSNSSCLTLVLADNLKEHITPDNLQPVTVLLQHSLETCPGLKSTFEILQKMMDIKGMSIDEAIDFIQKLIVSEGEEFPIPMNVRPAAKDKSNVAEVETEQAVAEEPEVHFEHEDETPADVNVVNHDPSEEHANEHENLPEPIVHEEAVVEHEAHEPYEADETPEEHEAHIEHTHEDIVDHEPEAHEVPETLVFPENDETNVEPSTEEDNTNPLDVVQSVLSIFEQHPDLLASLNEENDENHGDAPLEPEQ